MKQETLEEASIRLVPNRTLKTPFGTPYEITPTRERNTFKKGANWQAERMYSEEEVISIAETSFSFYRTNDFDDNELEEQWKIWLNKRLEKIKKK